MDKLFRIITLSLIFFMTGCSKSVSTKLTNKITEPTNTVPELTNTTPEPTNRIPELKFEDLESARIELGSKGANSGKYYTFDFYNSNHSKILKDVIK